ncbi:hypothetical protein V8C34DRAFT_303146 [Trichoderma compactum]
MANIHDSYNFGTSESLMIADVLTGLKETEPVREVRPRALYRGNTIKKKNMVSVLEVFDTPHKQILWIWFRDLDKFEGNELNDINAIEKDDETILFLVSWEAKWKKIAFARMKVEKTAKGEFWIPKFGTKEEFQAALNEISDLGHDVEVLDTKHDHEKGIDLAVVSVKK